jgi:hypothetical protein
MTVPTETPDWPLFTWCDTYFYTLLVMSLCVTYNLFICLFITFPFINCHVSSREKMSTLYVTPFPHLSSLNSWFSNIKANKKKTCRLEGWLDARDRHFVIVREMSSCFLSFIALPVNLYVSVNLAIIENRIAT